MAKGVLFDKDGTLIDFEAAWFPLVRDVLAELGARFAVPESALDRLRTVSGVTETGFARESLLQSGAASEILELWESILKTAGAPLPPGRLGALFDQAAASGRYPIRAVRGADILLSRLKGNSFRLGVVTGDSRPSTEYTLKAAGLLDFFDFLAADGDGYPPKPDPAAAEAFRSRFRIPRESLSMVGDSVVDMVFAQKAGARFLGIKTGCNDYTRFLREGFPVVEDFLSPRASTFLLEVSGTSGDRAD